MEEAAGFVSCGFFFVTLLSPLALRPGMRPVLQIIGRSGIGNMQQKGYSCDQSHGFWVTGNGCRPCTQVGSRPLRQMFCGIPNQRQSKSFSRWLNVKTLSIAECSAGAELRWLMDGVTEPVSLSIVEWRWRLQVWCCDGR